MNQVREDSLPASNGMKNRARWYHPGMKTPFWKKVTGVTLILIGILALITPFTPGSWLVFVGLEVFGIRLLAWDRIKRWLLNRKAQRGDAPPTDAP